MEWVRNHIIPKTENYKYGIRRNEKSVRLAGVKITLQAKTIDKKSCTVQLGFEGEPSTNILKFLNGSTFV